MERTATLQRGSADRLVDGGIAALRYTADFLCGFVLSGAELFGSPMPLAIGFAAACDGWGLVAAALGAAAGGWFRLSGGALINLLAPLCGLCAVKAALIRLDPHGRRRGITAAAVGLLSLGCGVAVLFGTQEAAPLGLLRVACAAGILAASAVFYADALALLRRVRPVTAPDEYRLVCAVISLCTLLLGFLEVEVFGFRPARCFGAFLVLSAAYLFSAPGGSVAGIAVGAGVAVSGVSPAPALSCGLCGLTAGMVARRGRVPCAPAFLAAAGVAALMDGSAEARAVFAESAAAGLAFLLIPGRRLAALRQRLQVPKFTRVEGEFHVAKERMRRAAEAIDGVSGCVNAVAAGVEALAPSREALTRMRVQERVCSQCPLNGAGCPENGEFDAALETLSRGERIGPEAFPAGCPGAQQLAAQCCRIYAGQQALQMQKLHAARSREIACGQFDWAAAMLRELSEELEANANVLYGKECTAARVFEAWEFPVQSVRCVRTTDGALALTCCAARIPAGVSLTRLTDALSAALEATLTPPEIAREPTGLRLRFTQRPRFRLRTGFASAGWGDRKICGDYAAQLQAGAMLYLFLSDGMGTGGRAAVDAAMTVELFARMLRAGLSADSALRIVNAALTVKSAEESLSTLDLAAVDLLTGTVTFCKAGAADSFCRTGGRVKRIELPSTPLGILSRAAFSRTAVRLRGGDLLALVSDGVLGCGSEALQKTLAAADAEGSAEALAQTLLQQARGQCGDRFDDMTVCVAVMEEL